jgi:hypothetical protein
MFNYLLTVKHDAGIVRIHTAATSVSVAKYLVMEAECCPERAIRLVRQYDDDGYEIDLRTGRRRKLAAHDVRTGPVPKTTRHDKRPTRYEVQVLDDQHWRRVYSTDHSGLHYIINGNLKVVVSLPSEAI